MARPQFSQSKTATTDRNRPDQPPQSGIVTVASGKLDWEQERQLTAFVTAFRRILQSGYTGLAEINLRDGKTDRPIVILPNQRVTVEQIVANGNGVKITTIETEVEKIRVSVWGLMRQRYTGSAAFDLIPGSFTGIITLNQKIFADRL